MNLYSLISSTIALAVSLFSLPLLNHYWFYSTPLKADLILTNAVIFTSDASLPFADSMAVHNGRILRLGNYSALQELAGVGTKLLNLDGKVVVPGFIDSHVHFIPGGLQMARLDLRGVNRKDEFVRRVKEAVKNAKEGSWVLGVGWNNDLWGGELPAASWIDDITLYNPVWLLRNDGHMGLANSVALQLAQITNSSEDPDGGTITKTSDGEPIGLLIDAAMELILPFIPEDCVDERREALLRASNFALTRGVTTVVDFGRYFPGASVQHPWEDFSDVYQWAISSAKMRIRVCLFFPLETWSRLADLIKKTGRALSNWVYLGGVKGFADGSLGSNSALFHEPYADDPHNYGLQVMETESLLNMTMAADRSGLQVAIHAIGDRANDLVLDIYKSVATFGARDRRFRPQQLLYDGDSAIKKLGMDRAEKESYLFQSLLASNVQLALGTDWPVVDLNPLVDIRTAMKRIPSGWDKAWIQSEQISLANALIAHTLSAAHACFLENDLGSLSPGKLADFVILSTDSWEDFATEGSASITATYVSGVQAYP